MWHLLFNGRCDQSRESGNGEAPIDAETLFQRFPLTEFIDPESQSGKCLRCFLAL
jgi:hypothetical protein